MINTLVGLGSLALLSAAVSGFYSSPSRAPRPGNLAIRIRMSSHDETFEPLRFDKRSERFGASQGDEPRRGRPGIVVFSGGTAFNAASAEMASRNVGYNVQSSEREGSYDNLSRSDSANSLVDMLTSELNAGESSANPSSTSGRGTKVWHVLPVTDDGGSTAEIVRVLGGPAVGDIRSRLLRLAPGTTREARAVLRLLGHRLTSAKSLKDEGRDLRGFSTEKISRMAREEWLDILDGGRSNDLAGSGDEINEHPLWEGVSAPYRSIIRSFLVHFNNQLLLQHNGVRQSSGNPSFDWTGGSVGNFFFAGARTFFGSLPAAIFLFSKVAGIPSGSRVLPAVLTEERLVLGAIFKDDTRIRGQYQISHPHPRLPPAEENQRDRSDSARHKEVTKSSIHSQAGLRSLHHSQIYRVAYLLRDPTWQRKQNANFGWSDRHEIYPAPNPLLLDALSNANCIVFGCGSLFTSVLPSLVLDGVGEAVARARSVPKVLLLNGWHDRETCWSETDTRSGELVVRRMDATDFVKAIVDALDQGNGRQIPLVTDYITHIFFPSGTEIDIDESSLAEYCKSRLQEGGHMPSSQSRIAIQSVESISANNSEGQRSGGQGHNRVYDPRALVDSLLDLASRNGLV